MKFQVHAQEQRLFKVMVLLSLFFHGIVGFILITNPSYIPRMLVYGLFISLFVYITSAIFKGTVLGNALLVGKRQFPELHALLHEHCTKLNMKVPDMYIMQGNGLLNAFAVRLLRTQMVVIYSDVAEVAYAQGLDAVSFVIGHELGHIKKNHTSFLKSLLIFPATWIPFLNKAYSRAREYTCDFIGYALCPQGARDGLLLLTAGKKLYRMVSIEQLLHGAAHKRGFAPFIAELFSTHPHLLKRIEAIEHLHAQDPIKHEGYKTARFEPQKEMQQ